MSLKKLLQTGAGAAGTAFGGPLGGALAGAGAGLLTGGLKDAVAGGASGALGGYGDKVPAGGSFKQTFMGNLGLGGQEPAPAGGLTLPKRSPYLTADESGMSLFDILTKRANGQDVS